jgi:hypothetical protein
MELAGASAPTPDWGDGHTRHEVGAVVLCGGVRPSPLGGAAGCSLLDLPFDHSMTIGEAWFAAFVRQGIPPDACVLATTPSESGGIAPAASFRITRDADPYRGPAGAVRDALGAIDGIRTIIIAEGSRVPMTSTAEAVVRAAAPRTIAVGVCPDGTYAGVLATDIEAIEILPTIGFIDLKEQWLPSAMKSGFRVKLCAVPSPSFRIRTKDSYLDALDRLGRFPAEASGSGRVVAGGSESMFGTMYGRGLASDKSTVSPTAVVAHAAVAASASIGHGAIVVRSVIGPGAVVRDNEVVLDRVVSATDSTRPPGLRSDRMKTG